MGAKLVKSLVLNLPPSCRIVASGHGTGCRSDEGGRWLMGFPKTTGSEDEALARKRLELVIVGASASLSRTHPIANVPLRRDIQSSGEIPLLIRCRCSHGGSTIQFMVGGSRDPGLLRRLLIKASGRVAGTIRARTFFSSLLSRIHRLLQAVMKPPCPGSARRRCKPPSRRQIRSASYAALPRPLRSNYGDPFALPCRFPASLPGREQLFAAGAARRSRKRPLNQLILKVYWR